MFAKHLKNKRMVLFFMVIALLAALIPASAQASSLGAGTLGTEGSGNVLSAQATKKTLKPIYSYDSDSTQLRKATLIKKKGTYALTLKNGAGIIRFKSPKTKTYSFTFSKLKSSQASSLACVAGFCKASSNGYSYKTIKTKEGKRPRVILLSANLANGQSVVFDGYSYLRLANRTAKIKVNKGSSIYIAMQAKDMDDDLVRSTLRLKIS